MKNRNRRSSRSHSTKRPLVAAVLGVVLSSVFLILFSNCGGSSKSNSTPVIVGASEVGPNIMPVSVGCGYINEPCVSVTICVPGTSNCQTINNVLLDTGSYGLRLFSQAITLPLTKIGDPSVAGNTLAECVSYADGSSDWGPLAKADVTLASETAPSVTIQIINAGFATAPTDCTSMDNSPADQGFNGILGVGLAIQDCGSGCEANTQINNANNGIYYTCTAAGACKGSVVPGNLQVSNPVAFLPNDNNGVILKLPSLPSNSATQVNGSLYLGIGTQANNRIGTPTMFQADSYANFVTTFNGSTSSSSFIDSGSNMYFFTDSALPQCTGDASGFYCPPSEANLTAVIAGYTGKPSSSVSFNVGNASFSLANAASVAISDIAVAGTSSDFDWGLPFFYGRSVYVGIEGKKSWLGTGPYWAF